MAENHFILQLLGGDAVVDWFGHIPNFHDAEIVGIRLIQGEISSLSLHAWKMTDAVDADGYFCDGKACHRKN